MSTAVIHEPGFSPWMLRVGRGFLAGDPCPKCDRPLERRGRSIRTMFMQPPYLKCPNCKLILRKRKGHF